MKGPVAAYTSVNLAYLDRALVLERTVRRFHPEWRLVLVLVDEPRGHPAEREALARFDEVMLLEDLGVPDARSWIFSHDVVEACTAVKGAALVRLLERHDAVVYLDPDTALFAPLTTVLDGLASHPVVVTPHQLTPARGKRSIQDNEVGSLLTGVYNLGFLGVRREPQGLAFAQWWASRLRDFCMDAPERGLFTDQRWMDLAPVYFDRLHVLRDPGLNVASWNIADRWLSLSETGEYLVEGSPLRLFHFTKALGPGLTMTLRYGGENLHVAECWRWYLQRLREENDFLPESGAWAYAAYDDGQPVLPAHRRAYRERDDVRRHFGDPFDREVGEWMRAHVE